MSKTSIKERNKAIRLAWEREQELVSEGKGTRDWSQNQQRDILNPDKGKVYDENGRAFEGQHMKSASEYPEYQGNPDNIQFLTREEHLDAHKGSWQNPTNWYYNPKTKEFVDFGENKPIPCEIFDLTEPVVRVNEGTQKSPETKGTTQKRDKEKSSGDKQRKETSPPKKSSSFSISTAKLSPKASKSFGEKIRYAVEAVKGFGERHSVLTGGLKAVGVVAAAIGTGAIANSSKGLGVGSKSSSSGGYHSVSPEDDYNYGGLNGDETEISFNECSEEKSGEEVSSSQYTPNDVPAGKQRYHYKDGSVKWKDKPSYHRGGNKDE